MIASAPTYSTAFLLGNPSSLKSRLEILCLSCSPLSSNVKFRLEVIRDNYIKTQAMIKGKMWLNDS